MFVRKSLRQVALVLAMAAVLITACSGGAAEPTVDVNAINTAAVDTAMGQLSAQFTQTALVAPTATAISVSTNTALPLPTFALPTAGVGTAAPTAAGGNALPTVSFNSTSTTPLAGFTALPTAAAGGSTGPTASLGDACDNSAYVSDVTIPDGTTIAPGVNFDKVWQVKNTGSCTWDDGYALVYIGGSDPNLDPYNFQFKDKSDWVTGGATANLGLTLTTPCTPGDYQGTWRMKNDKGYYFGTALTVVVKVTDKCK